MPNDLLRDFTAAGKQRSVSWEELAAVLGGLVDQVAQVQNQLAARVKALEARPSSAYRGVWAPGSLYEPGDSVTCGGSLWTCQQPTTDKPGSSSAFKLSVKKGRA